MKNHDTHRTGDTDHQEEHRRPQRNPRIVIGTLDYFDLLMEEDEQG